MLPKRQRQIKGPTVNRRGRRPPDTWLRDQSSRAKPTTIKYVWLERGCVAFEPATAQGANKDRQRSCCGVAAVPQCNGTSPLNQILRDLPGGSKKFDAVRLHRSHTVRGAV